MVEFDTTRKYQKIQLSSKSKFIGATFGYMFIALIITAITSVLCGYIFEKVNSNILYYSVMGVSYISLFGMMIWIQFSLFRGKHSLWAPFIIYSLLMGVVLSTFTMVLDFYTIAISVGITSVIFGLISLVGLFSKTNLSIFWKMGIIMIVGAFLMVTFNLLMFFLVPGLFGFASILVSILMFAGMMCISLYDVYRINQIASMGEANNNVALFCAFNLYTDFIYILIRIIQLVAISRRD